MDKCMKTKLVVIGNGMAGARTLEELLVLAPDKYEITVFGAEPLGNYNRILLSPLLAGEKTLEEIMINDLQWYADQGIKLHAGKRVIRIDRNRRRVVTSDGISADYDRLLLAIGSVPFVIPVPGNDLEGVITFRDIHDVNTMLAATQQYKRHAVVIGGGLLGLEAANGLLKQGMEVTVVHLLNTLMERQLDAAAAAMLKDKLERRGFRFLMEAQTDAILGDGHQVCGVRFKNGLEIPADLVVMAVGIRPHIDLASSAGIRCERGIVVNDNLQTSDPCIYAVGECVQHRGMTYGLVAPLWEQAKVCANHLAGMSHARYLGSITSTQLKVTGINLFSAGDFNGPEGSEAVVFQDSAQGIYKKLVLKQNRIQGAVLYGDTFDGAWYVQLMHEQTDIGDLREQLVFGRNHPDLKMANSG